MLDRTKTKHSKPVITLGTKSQRMRYKWYTTTMYPRVINLYRTKVPGHQDHDISGYCSAVTEHYLFFSGKRGETLGYQHKGIFAFEKASHGLTRSPRFFDLKSGLSHRRDGTLKKKNKKTISADYQHRVCVWREHPTKKWSHSESAFSE